MKINFLFIIFLFVISKTEAQDFAIKTYTLEQDNISFKASFVDKIYNLNDTLKITYLVENKNNFEVYIFDDNPSGDVFCSYRLDTLNCFSKLELGGNWMFNLETDNILFLRKIKRLSNYKFNLKILLTKKTDYSNCGSHILFSLNYLSDIMLYSYFLNIGYIKDENSEINFETDTKELIVDSEKGFVFERLIKRNILGPIYIKYKK